MKFFPICLSVAFAALTTLTGCARDSASTAPSATSDKAQNPIATVNGVPIPSEIVDLIIAEQHSQGGPENPDARESMKNDIRKELVRRALLEQDAIKAGIHKRPDTLLRQDLARQNALIRDFVQDWMKNNAPTDNELKEEYEKIRASLGDQKEYRARHILLKTEQEAKTAISRLDKGAKFAELAKKSLDPGTKDSGGDLGWASPALFDPDFSKAMTALSKGKYTATPVRTNYGYHVILLEDVRDMEAPSLDDVRPELEQQLQQRKWQEYVGQLEKNADVK
jgi:peptidyl-prolyl cis-trans isomerase C